MTCCLGRWSQSLPCVGVFRVLLGPGLHPAGFRVAERRRFCRSVRCANGPVSEAVHGLCGRCPFPPRPCAYTWHEDRERGGAGRLAQLRATQVICGQNACSLGVSVGTSTRVRACVCMCMLGCGMEGEHNAQSEKCREDLGLALQYYFPY